ncbi:MAG TPA: trypsin-like peptidase domain-containing protein, partial [Acidimicrobiales bacterium]
MVAAIALIAVLAIVLGLAGGTLLNQSIKNADAQTAAGANPNSPTLAPYGGGSSGSSSNTIPGSGGFDPTGGFGGSGTGSASGSGSDPSGSASTGGTGPSSTQAATIAAKVTPALVNINTRLGYQQAAAAGTGMILTSNGYILTNNHVVEDSTSITVTVESTGQKYTATVVGTDKTADVAVLKLTGASGLHAVSFAA